jgi:hypothetical protein
MARTTSATEAHEWADEQVLTTDDVAALGGGWKPTALFTWACLSQYYLGVDGPSLNESLILQPGGGALASFGPAGITPPARQAPLVARVYGERARPGSAWEGDPAAKRPSPGAGRAR